MYILDIVTVTVSPTAMDHRDWQCQTDFGFRFSSSGCAQPGLKVFGNKDQALDFQDES